MTNNRTSVLISATPVLPSLEIARTVLFYRRTLGFEEVHAAPRDYALCQAADIVHPKAPLAAKPWGTREFAVLDPDGNLLTFHQVAEA